MSSYDVNCVRLESVDVKQYKQVEVCRKVYRITGNEREEIKKLILGIIQRNFGPSLHPGSSVDMANRAINALFGVNCSAGYDPATGEIV